MEEPPYRRFDLTGATVAGWAHYGLLIETDDGHRGYVDASYVNPPAWPEIGTRVRGVVLGVAPNVGVRLALTRGYVAAVGGAEDRHAAAHSCDSAGLRPPTPPIERGDPTVIRRDPPRTP